MIINREILDSFPFHQFYLYLINSYQLRIKIAKQFWSVGGAYLFLPVKLCIGKYNVIKYGVSYNIKI